MGPSSSVRCSAYGDFIRTTKFRLAVFPLKLGISILNFSQTLVCLGLDLYEKTKTKVSVPYDTRDYDGS